MVWGWAVARTIGARDLEREGWSPRNLAMLAGGLVWGEGAAPEKALTGIMSCVARGELTPRRGWTGPELAMMLGAMGQSLYREALFDRLVSALVHRAGQEPGSLMTAIGSLCRFFVSGIHLAAVRRLLDAFDKEGRTPGRPSGRDDLLWNTTLCHFASLESVSSDPQMTAFFERHSRRQLACGPGTQGLAGASADERWTVSWARDYWQPSAAARQRLPTAAGETAAGETTEAVSFMQQQIFDYLAQAMPDHKRQMTVRVHGFCVDIVLDKCVCVEVDGPDHFVLAPGDGQTDARRARKRRTRDLFVDHMLRQYGYQVFRIQNARDPATLRTLVRQLRSALDRERH